MKHFISLILIGTLCSTLMGQESTLHEELSQLFNSVAESWASSNAKDLEPALAENAFFVQSGITASREQFVGAVSQKPKTQISDYSSTLITANEHIAYLSAKMLVSAAEGEAYDGVFCTVSFQKENGAWKLAHVNIEIVPIWKVREMTDDELDPLAKNACETESESSSKDTEVETYVRFKNESDQSVEIYWIDYKGKRKKYFELEPGTSNGGRTFVSHPWIVVSKENECLGVFHPTDNPGLVRIE